MSFDSIQSISRTGTTIAPEILWPLFFTLFGFSALFGVAILYGYRNQIRDKVHLLYGLGGLFLMGLGIRAMLVGAR